MSTAPIPILKPESSWVAITPATATRWLKANVNNRNMRPAVVNAYARDMGAGDWHLTGEAIKFAPDGALLDGQHRLAAIVKSGTTVTMLVVRNVPEDAQAVMDSGSARTAGDMLGLTGNKHASLLAAAARLGVQVERDADDKYAPTKSEIAEWIDDNPGIRMAAEYGHSWARRTDCPPAVVSYTYHRLSQIDPFEAAQFWMAAAEKVGLKEGDPVIALTNRFAETRRNRERLTRRVYLSLVYRAWNARRDGKTMRFLRVNSPSGGLVPVPEPH